MFSCSYSNKISDNKSIKSNNLYSQDDYIEALHKLNLTVTKAYKVNPKIIFEVFIHKVDGLGDDCKMETQRDIHQRANDELNDAGKNKRLIKINMRLPILFCRVRPDTFKLTFNVYL